MTFLKKAAFCATFLYATNAQAEDVQRIDRDTLFAHEAVKNAKTINCAEITYYTLCEHMVLTQMQDTQKPVKGTFTDSNEVIVAIPPSVMEEIAEGLKKMKPASAPSPH